MTRSPGQVALPEPSFLNAIPVAGARVVNLRTFWRPAGRLARGPARGHVLDLPPDVVRIDRATRWGNPYRIGAYPAFDRGEVIVAYRAWLARQLVDDPAFLEPLRGKRLGCWCAPEPCHGDVIAELIP